ncbi:Chaperone protein ClpB [Termitomyces sp. J132]|nr:Chaperone protein ClpB [Termitomyces sp. J132]
MQRTTDSMLPGSHPSFPTLLSPISITPLRLVSPIPDGGNLNEDNRDSLGSVDTLKPNPHSRMSPLKATFDIPAASFATPSSRVLSPCPSAFITRPLPSPFVLVPAIEDHDVPSDISLDSAADQSFAHDEPEPVPSEQYVVVGPETGVGDEIAEGPVSERNIEEELELDAIYSSFEEDSGDADDEDDTGAGDPTVGMPPITPEEVHDAFRQAAQTPVHFLADDVKFDESEAMANSSMPLSGPDSASSESYNLESLDLPAIPAESQRRADSPSSPSPCIENREDDNVELAQLAYLCSPALDEGDILHSLYDQYYDLSQEEDSLSEHNLIKAEVKNLSVKNSESPVIESPFLVTPLDDPLMDTAEIESSSSMTPARSGFFRERVFVPPPTTPVTRGRSGTIIAVDSSRSGSTQTVTCSFPQQTCLSSVTAPDPDGTVSEIQKAVVSKKVPFGFRKFMSRTDGTTFASHRHSMSIIPPVSTANTARMQHSENISPASAPVNGLRPLRLSTILTSSQPSSAPSHKSVFSADSYRSSRNSHRLSLSSASVSSNYSYSRNPLLLSSSHISVIPQHIRSTQYTTDDIPSPLSSIHLRRLATFESTFDDSPRSAPLSRPASWQSNPAINLNDASDSTLNECMLSRPFRRASEPSCIYEDDEDEQDERDHSICRSPLTVPHSNPRTSVVDHRVSVVDRRASVMRPPVHAVSVPKPTLMFAIASDDVKQVRRVLEAGDVGPNDSIGPHSALAFTLTNEQLTNKMEIVKTLLAYGADPKVIVQSVSGPVPVFDSPGLDQDQSSEDVATPPHPSLMDTLDPATRYYVERADASQTRKTSVLVQRSVFHPLTRVRYELIGQDRALEQLFKDLSIHSRQLSITPIVILLCGPSGHGKSLLARKFGSLLDVPTHTVGMTTVHSAQDLWKSYSMSPDDPPSTRTLAEFLCDNEGKRCVVVLDEIEKTHGESPLWALLMPWEHGRCTFEANGRLVDTRNVVWLGTSNIGQDLVFEHHNARALPDELMSKGEYTELMALLRPRVSERFGASMLSRVTTVLPFVPFTPEERQAICYEALYTVAGDIVQTLSTGVVDVMIKGALANYTTAEGARSIYRAVSNQLVETI